MNDRTGRRPDFLQAFVFIAAWVSLATPLLLLERYDLASQFVDDAYYYFQIAKNVALGHGVTFDGLHPTNGFHPLWLLMLVPVFRLFSGLDAGVRVAGMLEVALLGLAATIVYTKLRSRLGRQAALLAGLVIFAVPGTRHMVRAGLESAVSVFMLVATWNAWLNGNLRSARSWSWLGVCCGFAVLARLEAIVAVPVLITLERTRLSARPELLFAFLACALLPVSTYVVWNLVTFGIALPVSALVKHWWSQGGALYELPFGVGVTRATPWVVGLAPLIVLGVRFLAVRKPTWFAPARGVGIEFTALVAGGMLSIDYLSLGYVQGWYLGPLVVVIALMIASVLRYRAALLRIGIVVTLFASLARIPFTVWSTHHHLLQAQTRGKLADWIDEHLPVDAAIGSWNGGLLGYYSGRHIVMLDGLANSPEFYRRAVVGHDLLGYLRDEHIEFLTTQDCQLPGPSRAGLEYAYERIAFLENDAHGCTGLAIWKRR